MAAAWVAKPAFVRAPNKKCRGETRRRKSLECGREAAAFVQAATARANDFGSRERRRDDLFIIPRPSRFSVPRR